MEQRRFGSTQRAVAAIGQGTWYIDNGDRASAIAALRRGLDLGMTHIDTAEMYGTAEEVVAEAIVGRRTRSGFPSIQGSPWKCLADRDDRSLREIARSTSYRSARLLSVALARTAPTRGDNLGFRAASARGQDSFLGCEQLRCA